MKKLSFIIVIFLLIMSVFSSCSFASITINIDDTDFIISDKTCEMYSYFFIAKLPKDGIYMLVVGNTPFSFYSEGNARYIETTNFNCAGGRLNQISDYKFSSLSNISKYLLNNFTTSTLEFKYSNCDIVDNSSNVIHPSDSFTNPSFITTKEELASGKFDSLKIDAGDLDAPSDEIGLAVFDATSNLIEIETTILPNFKPVKGFVLNSKSDYFAAANLQVYYQIPQASLQLDISNGKKYMFCLFNTQTYEIYNSITFTVGGLTSEEEIKNSQDVTNDKLDEQTNAIKDQTEAMKEQTQTNKNIFEKIGDILSYINPFSENFFVYKLIELLVNAIKSLFIPSDDFFGNYFTELKDWFSDRLGFLFYPFEIVIDILSKMLNVNFNEPIFNIPDIAEPFTNTKLISATTFNLNSLVENGAFKVVHEIYFICLDAFIVFGLVNLFRRKYEEVTTK